MTVLHLHESVIILSNSWHHAHLGIYSVIIEKLRVLLLRVPSAFIVDNVKCVVDEHVPYQKIMLLVENYSRKHLKFDKI